MTQHTCSNGAYSDCPACQEAHKNPDAKWGDCRCLLCWECTR